MSDAIRRFTTEDSGLNCVSWAITSEIKLECAMCLRAFMVRTNAASITKLRSSLTFSFRAAVFSRDAMGTENLATLFLKSLFGLKTSFTSILFFSPGPVFVSILYFPQLSECITLFTISRLTFMCSCASAAAVTPTPRPPTKSKATAWRVVTVTVYCELPALLALLALLLNPLASTSASPRECFQSKFFPDCCAAWYLSKQAVAASMGGASLNPSMELCVGQ
mmetsp:Transcript_65165/g.131058  ORF Transcript_65165/g.131058 Transcript_65165/m.131058 type:complete len:222 (-) Transcript_65165:118-783(-)